ncbi:MAG: alcohol dehydrogenase catalytic domain-containing protein, partial [Methylocella sp.]
PENLTGGGFDLILAADALHRVAPDAALLARVVEAMAPEALLAAIEPAPSLFRDVVFGLIGDRSFATEAEKESFSSQSDWPARFAATPLRGLAVKTIKTAAGPALLVAGERPAFARRRNLPAKVVIASRGDPRQAETADALSSLLGAAGVDCTIAKERAFEQLSFADADTIVFLAPIMAGGATSAGHLAERCLTLKNFAAQFGKHKRRLWIESPGALRAAPGAADPVETGFWAFTRSFANEFPALDVRRVDLDPGLPARVKARRLADIILSGTAETEIILDAHSTRVVRLQARDSAAMAALEPLAPASRLEKGEGTGLDRIRWMPIERRPPEPGQVEIAVAASGLNFRDVMWGLSVLPDEMLEDGLAGPALGLECAGHIVATGANVEGLNTGDAVVAITGGAFATHVTVDTRTVARVPEGLPLEAAVTIPVAFLTAYYA